MLGVKTYSIENDRMAQYYNVSRYGVLVSEVTLQSTADAGLRAGDLIIMMDDHDIQSYSDLKAALALYKAGDNVQLTVLRDNKEVSFRVTLAEKQ